MTQVTFSNLVDIKNAEKLVEMLENLDNVEDIKEMIKLAVKA